MQVFIEGQGTTHLHRSAFVGQGGEGTVYALGDTAIKLWDDPQRVPPVAKLQRLAQLRLAHVAAPRALVRDEHDTLLGYTMPFVDGGHALASLVPPVARRALGLDLPGVTHLVEQLRTTVHAAHQQGVHIVDLSENNVLIHPNLRDVSLIDVDSWQVPPWPATALSESIRDRLAPPGQFTEQTDWFAFAVVTFALAIGMHPYRGKHPTLKGLDARMTQQVSVFDPEVIKPSCCLPLRSIPQTWRDWYHAVFEQGVREPPPGVVSPWAAVQPTPHQSSMYILPLLQAEGDILALGERMGQLTYTAGGRVWTDRRVISPAPAGRDQHLVWPKGRTQPVALGRQGRTLTLIDCQSQRPLPAAAEIDDLCIHDNRIIIRRGEQLLELELTPMGSQLVPTQRPLGRVLPHATRCLPGVVVQDVFGSCWLTLLPAGRAAPQLRVPELDGARWLHGARTGRCVVGLVAQHDRYDRVILRFDSQWAHYDLRRDEDVPLHVPQAVALDHGALAVADAHGGLLVMAQQPHDTRLHHLPEALGSGTMVPYRGGLGRLQGPQLEKLTRHVPPG